ncbi:MAG: hypothetical protein NTU98_04540 [Bacteroidetes bacterium]|nr:hypothetical protein [Bacteroidota bacterium]
MILLLFFLAGNTGISFFVHTCGSTHKKDVFVFREIFHQQMACCCEENPSERMPASSGSEFNDDDCCRISHLFVKASFTALPVLEKITIPETGITLFPDFALLRSEQVLDSKASFIPFLDHSPPPLSGIRLVHFLHQIRIPAPVC